MTDRDELTTKDYDRFVQRLTRRLRIKISGLLGGDDGEPYPYAQHLTHLPDLVGLVADLAVDDRVPEARRRLLVAALVYVMSTGDLLPEAVIGPVGMADDLVVVAQTLEAVLRAGPAEVARALWQGDGDLEAVIQGVLANGEAMVGPTVWSRLPGWVEAS